MLLLLLPPPLTLQLVYLPLACAVRTGKLPLIQCVPAHVHHCVFEVLKNALRATVASHVDVTQTLPPVTVRVAAVRSCDAAFLSHGSCVF